jgi:hypothetical protein
MDVMELAEQTCEEYYNKDNLPQEYYRTVEPCDEPLDCMGCGNCKEE